MEFNHKSVLLFETVDSLDIKPDGIYVDGTVGGAGHSLEIAKRLTDGHLYAFDRDPDAVKTASERLKGFNATVIHSNFDCMAQRLNELGVTGVDGIMLDLGVSSYQLDTADRGFSFHLEAPLDMRMSREGTSAFDVVNNYSEKDLVRIFNDYGEERFARNIAASIERERKIAPIKTTTALAEIIANSYPAKARRDGHPARKCFQAIRIEVNGELECLKTTLDSAFGLLNKGGVFSVITFHSLEDRIVKQKFKEFCTGCICPPDLPVCVCGRTPLAALKTRKPIQALDEELLQNPRSRSAKLRSIVKL